MSKHLSSFVLVSFLAGASGLSAQSTDAAPEGAAASEKLVLDPLVITGKLDQARESIVPELGASSFHLDLQQIQAMPQGVDASFNEVLLRVPGVAEDSFGQVHLRGEHANLQYRINDVLLPEGLSGFGQELDTRFADSVSVLTGALPAQFGFRTAGVVDIHTKGGALERTRMLSLYAGSQGTFKPSLELGGSAGPLNYFATASVESSDGGIENPTASTVALHDQTRQERAFAYLARVLDAGSRVSVLLSASRARFQIPNSPGQAPVFALAGTPGFDSIRLDENQREANAYAIVAYQKSTGTYDLQASAFVRSSAVHFRPDPAGDLVFNGVASDVERTALSSGVEVNARWLLTAAHTLRGGWLVTRERTSTDTVTAVFPVDAAGAQAGDTPFSIADRQTNPGWLAGIYAQDEWKLSDRLTFNFGARADTVSAQVHEGQLSPRLNLSYQLDAATTFHAGYARYFTPPPLELVQAAVLAEFAGTTNAPAVNASSPVRSERSHYFDLGLTRQVTPAFALTVDGYLKLARNQLDEGQFGQALIFAPFNYRRGQVEGIELGANYARQGFTAYMNLAVSRGTGREIVSGEFQFDPDELAYIATHDVALDHDQRYSLSSGVSYHRGPWLFYADALYGSGLRKDFANTGVLPAYHPVNLGAEHTWKFAKKRQLKLRLDVTNVFDEVYELRDGSGIGVGAPQYGARRGFYGGMSLSF